MGAIHQLPLPDFGPLDPLEALSAKSRRLGEIVAATSRRRDVRFFRAKLLILLLELRVPLNSRQLRQTWYVRGAVARLGAEGVRRSWRTYFGEEPRSVRTFRSHLTVLENSLAIIRAPGDWLWTLRDVNHPERRPRHADTFHVLESERAAAWWATIGRELLDKNPRTRSNPDVWAKVFGDWRTRAAHDQLELFHAQAAIAAADAESVKRTPENPETDARNPEDAETVRSLPAAEVVRRLVAIARTERDPLEIMLALRECNLHVRGRVGWRMAAEPERAVQAVAMLAVAIARGDRIRSRSGWLVRAFTNGDRAELRDALRVVRSGAPTCVRPRERGPTRARDLLPAARRIDPGVRTAAELLRDLSR